MAEGDKGDDLATLVCNIFYIRCYDGVVRAAFGEGVPGRPPKFHTAIRLTRADAEELCRVVGVLLEESAEETGGRKLQ